MDLTLSEGDPPINIGAHLQLTDADSVNSNVTVEEIMISVASAEEEMLFLERSDPDIAVVSFIENFEREDIFILVASFQNISDDGSILLSGVAPLSNYEQLLQSLSYALDDTLEPPCPLNRTIDITLTGGE